MFKRILKNRKAQQTAEYALLISLVIAAVVAMQTYAQRALQGRIRAGSNYMVEKMSENDGFTDKKLQYEPYYLDQSYEVDRTDVKTEQDDGSAKDGLRTDQISNTIRTGVKTIDWKTGDDQDPAEW